MFWRTILTLPSGLKDKTRWEKLLVTCFSLWNINELPLDYMVLQLSFQLFGQLLQIFKSIYLIWMISSDHDSSRYEEITAQISVLPTDNVCFSWLQGWKELWGWNIASSFLCDRTTGSKPTPPDNASVLPSFRAICISHSWGLAYFNSSKLPTKPPKGGSSSCEESFVS